MNKAMGIHVIEAQVSSERSLISCEAFIADVARITKNRSSEPALLLVELGLGATRLITPSVSRSNAVQLYLSVVEKIAYNTNIRRETTG